jgi:hypothetical protein
MHTCSLSAPPSSRPIPFSQALLEGISLSQPQPKIPPELIKFLGKSFNAWHIAIPLLESHVIIFPDEGRCFDALAELYKQVGLYALFFCVSTLRVLGYTCLCVWKEGGSAPWREAGGVSLCAK